MSRRQSAGVMGVAGVIVLTLAVAGSLGGATAPAGAAGTSCSLTVSPTTNLDGSVPATVTYDADAIHAANSAITGVWTYFIDYGGGASDSQLIPGGAQSFNITIPAGHSSVTGDIRYGVGSGSAGTVICNLSGTGRISLPLPTPSITATAGALVTNADATASREYVIAAGPSPFPTDATLVVTDGANPVTPGTLRLLCGSSHTFTASLTRSGVSLTSTPAAVTVNCPAPAAPVLTATADDRAASVSWTVPAGDPVDSYVLTYGPSATWPAGTTVVTQKSTSMTVSGLKNGSPYSFAVTAKNAAGTSASSNIAQATPNAQKPPAPTITPRSLSGTSINIDYTLPTTRPQWTALEYQYSVNNGPWQTGGTIAKPADAGQFSVTASGLKAPDSASVQLRSINDNAASPWVTATLKAEAPSITYPKVTGKEDSALSANVTYTSPANMPHAGAVFTAAGLPAGVAINAATGTISGTPRIGFVGPATVTLTVAGGATSIATVNFDVDANPISTAITYPSLTGQQGKAIAPVSPNLGRRVPTNLFYSSPNLCTLAPGLDLNKRTGVITGTPTAAVRVAADIVATTVEPSDGCGKAPTDPNPRRLSVTISVIANPSWAKATLTYNGAPRVALTVPEGTAMSLAATLSPAQLTKAAYAITSGVLPAGLALNPATGAITGTPTALFSASDITISASVPASGSPTGRTQTAAATVRLTVVTAGTTPALLYAPAFAVVGQRVSQRPTTTDAATAFSLVSGPAGVRVDPSSGTITWVPSVAGTYTVTIGEAKTNYTPTTVAAIITVSAPAASRAPSGQAISAGGSAGGSASGSAGGSTAGSPNVPSACRAPNGRLFADMTGSVGSSFAVDPNGTGFTDPDKYTVTSGSLPDGIMLDQNLGVIYGTPTRSNQGRGPVTISASWTDGTVLSYPVNIAISDPHQSLSYPIVPISNIGVPLKIRPTTYGPVGRSRYSVACGTLPNGLTLNPRTGEITGAPTEVNLDPNPLRVRRSDRFGQVDGGLILPVTDWGLPYVAYPDHPHVVWRANTYISPMTAELGNDTLFTISRGKLPSGLRLNRRTGEIFGKPKALTRAPRTVWVRVNGGGQELLKVPVTITVGRPVVALRVTAAPASLRPAVGRETTLVTRIDHLAWAPFSVTVACSTCRYAVDDRTGQVRVRVSRPGTKVRITVVTQSRSSRSKYRPNTWTRMWQVPG